METRIVAVDLGGTRIRVARLNGSYSLLNRVEEPTRAWEGPAVTIPRIMDLIAGVVATSDHPVQAIGISTPGPIDPETGAIKSPPNLDGWIDVPLGRLVQARFPDIPTFIENDANVAALAEVQVGAGRGHRHAVYITVSTGIGSGIVIDGELFLGGRGLAGEFGHTIMVVEADRVSSLEEEAAGPAIAAYAARRIRAGAESRITALVEGDLSAISGSVVGKAAAAGDALALEAVTRAGRLVGYGIANLMMLLNPTVIVVGGGVSTLGPLLFDPMRQAAREAVIDPAYYEQAPIVPAELGADVAIIGAAVLAARGLAREESQVSG
ncbi:MAG: ROK family protein [Anaerolineae bacterium]|nr:ROK family protein [Anaerolineae bacterium]